MRNLLTTYNLTEFLLFWALRIFIIFRLAQIIYNRAISTLFYIVVQTPQQLDYGAFHTIFRQTRDET